MKLTAGQLILIGCLLFSARAFAQSANGDEDREMFNKTRRSDDSIVVNAKQTWYGASLRNKNKRLQWWRDARFGMFVHWGIYSVAGGEWKGKKVPGYSEHLMRIEKIPMSEYIELAHQFNPRNFNAERWVLAAKNAGMKYFIITAKHHDGFAMYDSKVSDYNVIKQTPFKRDPMAELAAACRKYGMKFGFYYSHAFDWGHPDAPGNDWEYANPGGDRNLYGGRDWYSKHPELLPKVQRYVNEIAIPQIKELIKNYHPNIMWFDTPHKLPLSENLKILKSIRETDPDIVVNGRLTATDAFNFGDYKNTGDRPAEFYPVSGDWEAIPTTNESYGYSKYDTVHKPASFFIRLLAKAASRGGNLLLNIGPKGDGSFDEPDVKILEGIGKWMKVNGESIYGTKATPLPAQSWGVSTQKGNDLFLHVFNYPPNGKLYVGGIKSEVNTASLLASPSAKIKITRLDENDVLIQLPPKPVDSINTVVILKYTGALQTDTVPFIAPNSAHVRLLAFDAKLHGEGLGYGDGKADRYYVENWIHNNQWLSWHFRTIKPSQYKVLIKYVAGKDIGGTYELKIDGIRIKRMQVKDHIAANNIVTEEIAEVNLNAGVHEISILPDTITKKELMKIFELQLIKSKN